MGDYNGLAADPVHQGFVAAWADNQSGAWEQPDIRSSVLLARTLHTGTPRHFIWISAPAIRAP
jgi:hypothetical protein